jgi:NAD(P)-dependent dehydrogenase (short-subunit alcohol dehydrogenase family)
MQPTTLITGAGKRIGAAIARHLAARGHSLVLHYHRSQAEAEALAHELRAGGTTVTLVQADLEHTADLATFWQGLPPVTHIIHNASRYVRDTLADFTAADLRAHLAVHVESPLLLTQGFFRQFPAGAAGNVIILGDGTLGWSVSPEFFTYAVSKHAWASLIDLLAAACAPSIRANVIALAPTLPNTHDPVGLFDRLAQQAPLNRTGDVVEVLSALDFLLINPAVTGQIIDLSNGMGIGTNRA